MPECQNCGSFVTSDYVRVRSPEGVDNPRCCPNCDKIRTAHNEIREKRSTHGTPERTTYDGEVVTDGGVVDE